MPTKKPEPVKRPPGRPTKYTADTARQAEKLARLGATDRQIADFMQINPETFHAWKKVHPELVAALAAGKEEADNLVEKSLFSRAIGYSHAEEDIRTVSVGAGISEIRKTPTTKHYPPDVVACIFWLKNRRPDKWRTNPVEGEDAPDPVKVTLEVVDGRRPVRAEAESPAG